MHDQLAGGVRRRRRAQTTDMNPGLQQRLQVRGEGVKTVIRALVVRLPRYRRKKNSDTSLIGIRRHVQSSAG